MKRRNWLLHTTGTLLSFPLFSLESPVFKSKNRPGSFALDGNRIKFFHPEISRKFSILMLADTHLFRDDERGTPYKEFSARMAKAYNQTKHYKSGVAGNPETFFVDTLKTAADKKVELVALVGDLFSFPSEAAVDWVQAQFKNSTLDYCYTAGNHDWHYEGMKDNLENLRQTWIRNHLSPMYQGENPMYSIREIMGIRFLFIDNSTYQIQDTQLEMLKKEISRGKPFVLLLHIPIFAPERPVNFGCGHPLWNAETDRNFELERRERWPENGHTATTMEFRNLAFNAPNLLGILAGHIHAPSLDVVNGIPQFVTEANAVGGFLEVEFFPA